MVGTNKILTVSYGTFSCTLEGFDDPLEAIRTVTEYFRDLSAEDRYFGAEPPPFDLQALEHLTQNDANKPITARVDDTRLVLSQSEGDAAPAESRAQRRARNRAERKASAKARALADTQSFTQAEAVAPEPEPAEPADDSIAAKMQRIRAAVARSAAEENFDEEPESDKPQEGLSPISAAFADVQSEEAEVDPEHLQQDDTQAAVTAPVSDLVDGAYHDVDPSSEDDTNRALDADEPEGAAEDPFDVTPEMSGADHSMHPLDTEEEPAEPEAEEARPGLNPDNFADAMKLAASTDPSHAAYASEASQASIEHGSDVGAGENAPLPSEDPFVQPHVAGTDDEPHSESHAVAEAAPWQPGTEPQAFEETGTGVDVQAGPTASHIDGTACEVTEQVDLAIEAEAVQSVGADDEASETARMRDAGNARGDVTENTVADDEAEAAPATDPEQDSASNTLSSLFARLEAPEAELIDPAPSGGVEPVQPTRLVRARLVRTPPPETETPFASEADDGPQPEASEAADLLRTTLDRRGAQDETAEAPAPQDEAVAERPDNDDDGTDCDRTAATQDDTPDEAAHLLAIAAAAWDEDRDAPDRTLDDEEPGNGDAPAATDEEVDTRFDDAAKLDEDSADSKTSTSGDSRNAPLALTDPIMPDDAARGEDESALNGAAETAMYGEDESELQNELAEVEREVTENQNSRGGRSLLEAHRSAESSVTRILRETESQLDDSEASRRRTTIAHLKAAVAAARADRDEGPRVKAPDQALDLYRKDLGRVVRPYRQSDSQRPTAGRGLAPLLLVSEQRVDLAKDDRLPDIRPRRITTGNLALLDYGENESNSDSEDAQDPAVGSVEFADFAKSFGATKLVDLIEAAAAYSTHIEGRHAFSRPALMKRVSRLEGFNHSREDMSRAFGKLLRKGKIVKLAHGQFTIADGSRFRPE